MHPTLMSKYEHIHSSLLHTNSSSYCTFFAQLCSALLVHLVIFDELSKASPAVSHSHNARYRGIGISKQLRFNYILYSMYSSSTHATIETIRYTSNNVSVHSVRVGGCSLLAICIDICQNAHVTHIVRVGKRKAEILGDTFVIYSYTVYQPLQLTKGEKWAEHAGITVRII